MVLAHENQQTEFSKLTANMPNLGAEEKACLGSMLGAFVGDSLGSFREFKMNDCPDHLIEEAM